tara:strand:+ start:679 stop:1200 length:522 start_codon:yes stop_codon:yes gene_type:complete
MGLGGIIEAVIGIGDIFVNLANLVVLFVKLFAELIPAAVSLFNPVELMNDIIAGVFLGIKVIITGVVDMIMGGPKFAYNKCKDAGEGIFGYRRYRNNQGKLSAEEEVEKAKKDRRVCLRPSTFIMLITVLCPPLGLFLHLGIRSWFHIIVCAFLTVKTYYFPGLLYAIMHMLC